MPRRRRTEPVPRSRKVILVDQDGPLADFERGFLKVWRSRYPSEDFIPLAERTTRKLRDQYPGHLRPRVEEVYSAPGFYVGLPSVSGGVRALRALVGSGHYVWICTSPLSRYENCVLEKYQWVEKHLGREFTKNIILTKDKTLIQGDLLIDDNPCVDGIMNPAWELVLFDTPYNRQASGKKRLTWRNWKEVLDL